MGFVAVYRSDKRFVPQVCHIRLQKYPILDTEMNVYNDAVIGRQVLEPSGFFFSVISSRPRLYETPADLNSLAFLSLIQVSGGCLALDCGAVFDNIA